MYTKSNRLLCAALTGVMLFSPIAPYVRAAESAKTVTIIDDGRITASETEAYNIEQLLEEQNISLGEEDIVSHLSDESVKNDMVVEIDRVKNYIIQANGGEISFSTAEKVDKKLLASYGVTADSDDYIKQSFDSERNSYIISVVNVTITQMLEEETLENSTVEIATDELYTGQQKVETEGQNGLVSKNYLVRYENGEEVSKVMVSKTVTVAPVDRVVKIGTKERAVTNISPGVLPAMVDTATNTITTSSGKVLTYSNVIEMKASAYDLSYESCGKLPGDVGYGVTASGLQAAYGVIAVDPTVIPLGTKLYIECPDGGWVYGEAIAGDVGGAIKGNRIDLFYNTRQEALNFGRRPAMVYVLAE